MGDGPGVAILVGSLRAGSLNYAAAEVAERYLSGRADVSWPDLSLVPFFNQDVEEVGDPPAVVALKHAVAVSEIILIFTPEYNFGVPAVTKNAIDWLSRPFGNGCLADRIVGIVAVGPSSRGGENVREELLRICGVLSERVYPETLGIPKVSQLANNRLPEAAENDVRLWVDQVLVYSKQWPGTTP
ncbi:MAG: NAD(P)H-dependent oxidoreductase [Actinomycetota bacterium]|nr:NAD(P)H-dependent oxidoreductase [Actinomycetota bacterium]